MVAKSPQLPEEQKRQQVKSLIALANQANDADNPGEVVRLLQEAYNLDPQGFDQGPMFALAKGYLLARQGKS